MDVHQVEACHLHSRALQWDAEGQQHRCCFSGEKKKNNNKQPTKLGLKLQAITSLQCSARCSAVQEPLRGGSARQPWVGQPSSGERCDGRAGSRVRMG